MHYFNGQFTKFEQLAVFADVRFVVCCRIRSVDDRGAGFLAQVDMAAYNISMKMCFENILDAGLSFGSHADVFIGIPEGVDDGCFSFTFDVVRCFAQAACI